MRDSEEEKPLDERLEEADQRIEIEKIKKRLDELSGGQAVFGEMEEMPPEEALAFYRHVLRFEEAPQTTLARLLIEQGVALPSPDELSDQALHDTLWDVIHGLHEQRTFLYSTDHLSDRELYELLWGKLLNEDAHDLRGDMASGCHLDLLGGRSARDIETWLTYYADEEERALWKKDWPDQEIPPHCDTPYDRDRHLPKREGF